MVDNTNLTAGSRNSQLAIIQTEHVISLIKKLDPDRKIELCAISTKGDKILDKPLPKVGKNVFTKELEELLLDGKVSFVVHSLKDVATSQPEGLTIGAVLSREEAYDAVITTKELFGTKLGCLPSGSVVGTSSLRRAAQLRAQHPHLVIKDVRGNLNTRLRKLDESGEYAAIVLALAGIRRMGWEDRVSEVLSPNEMLYAVGQGALAVQCRKDDDAVLKLLSSFIDEDTVLKVIAERTFMQALGGGCTAPLAVETDISNGILKLTGGVWSLSGEVALLHSLSVKLKSNKDDDAPPPSKRMNLNVKDYTGITASTVDSSLLEQAHQLGLDLAEYLRGKGAAEVIAAAKIAIDRPLSPHSKPIEAANNMTIKHFETVAS